MKTLFLTLQFITYLFIGPELYAQKHDYNWAMGFGFPDTIEDHYKGNRVFVMKFGEAQLKFDTVFNSYYDLTKKYINLTDRGTASYSDFYGNFKYATEGKRIYDASWNVMQNGDTLNAGINWSKEKNIYIVPYGIIPIPDPLNKIKYSYLLHTTKINPPFLLIPKYSKIDLETNNGLGKVIEKNITLFENVDSLEQPMVVQHANGRDWWVFYHKYKTKLFYKKLLGPNGFIDKGIQEIGLDESPLNNGIFTSVVSNKGDKYCRYDPPGVYRIYDFDRCSGLLSNPKIFTIPDSLLFFGYFCFSPSGQFIYATGQSSETLINYFTQIDISTDPITYKIIAFNDPNKIPDCNGYTTLELGPDGKLYVGSTSSKCISIINKPDELYPNCDLQQFLEILPFNNLGPGMPHIINYRLGPLIGSGCDTITEIIEPNVNEAIKLYPNPASATVTIELMDKLYHNKELSIVIVDISGKEIYHGKLPPFAYIHNIVIDKYADGIYCILLKDGYKLISSKKLLISKN